MAFNVPSGGLVLGDAGMGGPFRRGFEKGAASPPKNELNSYSYSSVLRNELTLIGTLIRDLLISDIDWAIGTGRFWVGYLRPFHFVGS